MKKTKTLWAACLCCGIASSMVFAEVKGKPAAAPPGLQDLVDVESLNTGNLRMDLRYATPNNFTGKQIYQSPKCVLQRDAAAALLKASELARKAPHPFTICVLDCYRPLAVQKIFWSIMPDERYVASPVKGSRHNRGMAVDVTACAKDGVELQMPTAFDDFTPKAARDAVPKNGAAGENFRELDRVMQKAGFQPFPSEWWHYDFPGWESVPVLDVPIGTK